MFSFVLKYPFRYSRLENGDLVTDQNKQHPDIHYLGYFSEDKNEIFGNWEMYEEEYINENELTEYIFSGDFNMKKV